MWAQFLGIARNDQLEQADRVCIVKDECVIRMLERPLHLFNVVSASADINLWVLWVLDTKSISCSFIVPLPALRTFLKVLSASPDGQTDILIVELRPVKLQKVNQVLAEVYLIGSTLLVLSLQIACDHHSEKK